MDVQKSSEAFEVIREIMDDEALLEFFGNASAILGVTCFLVMYFCKSRVYNLRKESK